jgi:serine/threonine-protein kinase
VDTAGDLYVAHWSSTGSTAQVMKLAAGTSTPTVLPFTVDYPGSVAVDAAGTVYVTEHLNSRVLKLAAGSSTPTVLPFTGLNFPWHVAVDNAGSVYVADQGKNRVVKLPAG